MSFVHRMRSAFSLIEVLVATVIMSIVAAGIFSLVIYVQGSNLSLISNINLFGEQDKTSKFLREKLGQAESVSIADAHGQDKACLELISRKVTELKGYELAGQTAVTHLGDRSRYLLLLPMMGDSLTRLFAKSLGSDRLSPNTVEDE